MGAASTVGVVGAFGAVIALAFGGPEWAVAWLVLAVAVGVALQVLRRRRRDRPDA